MVEGDGDGVGVGVYVTIVVVGRKDIVLLDPLNDVVFSDLYVELLFSV